MRPEKLNTTLITFPTICAMHADPPTPWQTLARPVFPAAASNPVVSPDNVNVRDEGRVAAAPPDAGGFVVACANPTDGTSSASEAIRATP
jgi:hypothetical protein